MPTPLPGCYAMLFLICNSVFRFWLARSMGARAVVRRSGPLLPSVHSLCDTREGAVGKLGVTLSKLPGSKFPWAGAFRDRLMSVPFQAWRPVWCQPFVLPGAEESGNGFDHALAGMRLVAARGPPGKTRSCFRFWFLPEHSRSRAFVSLRPSPHRSWLKGRFPPWS